MYSGKKGMISTAKDEMKGSVSFAKHDLDNLPMRNWVGSNAKSMVRQETKSRVNESRGVNVSELTEASSTENVIYT